MNGSAVSRKLLYKIFMAGARSPVIGVRLPVQNTRPLQNVPRVVRHAYSMPVRNESQARCVETDTAVHSN